MTSYKMRAEISRYFECHKSVYWVLLIIGIDTKIGVIVVSPTTWEAHHSPREAGDLNAIAPVLTSL